MESDDLSALFFGDEAEGPSNAAALAKALRGQQQLGTLGLLTGDKVLGGVGQQLLRGAQEKQELIPKAANMRLQRAMEAEKARTEAQWRAEQGRHMQQQEAIARQQLAQGKFVQGQWGVLNTKTGDVDPYVKPPKEPSPKDVDADFTALTKAISTSQGRGNINVEQQKRLNASERIKAIAVNPDGTPKNLNPNTMVELAAASAAMISGGSPAMHTIEAMTPSSVGSDWSKIQQWLTNEPAGTDQRKFVQLMLDQANREEETIKPQIRAAQLQALPNYAHLSKKDANRYRSILKSNGIDPDSVDESGLERMKQAEHGGAAAPGKMDPKNAARLAELRALRAAGKLK